MSEAHRVPELTYVGAEHGRVAEMNLLPHPPYAIRDGWYDVGVRDPRATGEMGRGRTDRRRSYRHDRLAWEPAAPGPDRTPDVRRHPGPMVGDRCAQSRSGRAAGQDPFLTGAEERRPVAGTSGSGAGRSREVVAAHAAEGSARAAHAGSGAQAGDLPARNGFPAEATTRNGRFPGPTGNRLTVLSGPSGVGKSTVVAELRRTHPEVWLSVSVTTRKPRPGETDGVEYHFVDDAEFDRLVAAGELLEWAEFAGNRYGTPAGPVLERLAAGVPTLLEIDLQGARQVRAAMPEALLVFLAPPSWEVLESRLRGRGTEPEDVIARRLAAGRVEMAAEPEFDITLVNTSVQDVCERLIALMRVHSVR